MTPFKQAQRAQALYDDPQLPRRDLADMTARLEAENEELRKLLSQALTSLENACYSCSFFEECDVVNDLKCVAVEKIRKRMASLGVRA